VKKQKILYWDVGKSSFVKKDLEILRSEFRVCDYTFQPSRNLFILFEFFRQFIICMIHVWTCRIVVCQFAGYHSLIPLVVFKLYGRKSLIIAGGTDCVAFPSIKYGNFQKKYLRWFTVCSFKLTDIIAPVDESLIFYDYSYQSCDYVSQGYRFFVKKLKAQDCVIYNGYDSTKFGIVSAKRKDCSFLTVAADLSTPFSYCLKGIDLVVSAARELPNFSFSIVGGDKLQIKDKPDNLTLLSNFDNSDLVQLYNDHQFYLQLSMSEGFPNALCEAMLCGCIPIVSDVGAMRKIVGDSGFILEKKSLDLLKALLKTATSRNFTFDDLLKARARISEHYTLKNRQVKLISLIEKLVGHD